MTPITRITPTMALLLVRLRSVEGRESECSGRRRDGTLYDLPTVPFNDVSRRSARTWVVLASRLIALGCFTAGIVIKQGAAWALMAVAVGLLLVSLTWRRKAVTAPGAIWSAAADLLAGGRQFPGQISLTPSELVWIPSRYSMSKGRTDLTLPLLPEGGLHVEPGPGLLDLQLVAPDSTGASTRFLTHRSRRLRLVLKRLGSPPHL